MPGGMRRTQFGMRMSMSSGFSFRFNLGFSLGLSLGQEAGESKSQSQIVLVVGTRKIKAGCRGGLRNAWYVDWRPRQGGLDCTRWRGGFDFTGFTRRRSGLRIRLARRVKRCRQCLALHRRRRRDQRRGVGEQRQNKQQHRYQTLMAGDACGRPVVSSIDASIATSNHHWVRSESGRLSCDADRSDESGMQHERPGTSVANNQTDDDSESVFGDCPGPTNIDAMRRKSRLP